MKIGITCYPVLGGSGIVATELGMALAAKGHQVHFISYQLPFRLDQFRDNVFFHQVDISTYPLFKYPPYTLSLAAKMADVVCRWKLDLLHVHYAIPHATAAFLAKQIARDCRIKVVTTLHGTDVTLVGSERSFYEITRFSLEASDGLTAVSESIKKQTYEVFDITAPIEVIPNFVNIEEFKPNQEKCARSNFAKPDEKIVMHASNFRPVKRVKDVLEIFRNVRDKLKAKLVLLGDGPDMTMVEDMITSLGLNDHVHLLGSQNSIEMILPAADLFLLPSETESFGLAALEAMSCGVPVIASDAGGLPELVSDGDDGFLRGVGDVGSMSQAAIEILSDDSRLERMKLNARESAVNKFAEEKIVPLYEDYYLRVASGRVRERNREQVRKLIMAADCLAIAAHRDDLEITSGGLIAKLGDLGKRVVMLDLTAGEMGSFGDEDQREREAEAAAKVLGVKRRENLGLPDAYLKPDHKTRVALAQKIRDHRPELVILPHWEQRHPDHRICAQVGYDACFYAGLKRARLSGGPHRPRKILYAVYYGLVDPNVIFDITDQFERKLESIKCYQSQFPDSGRENKVFVPGLDVFEFVRTRDRALGMKLRVGYAEGYVQKELVGINSPFDLLGFSI